MNTFKKTGSILLAAALVLSAPAVFANHEHEKGKDWDPAKKIEKMKTELGLTDEQTAKIKAIFDAKKAEMEAARQAMEERRKKNHDEIAAVLTEEQRVKFEEQIAKGKEKRKECKMGKECKVEKEGKESGSES